MDDFFSDESFVPHHQSKRKRKIDLKEQTFKKTVHNNNVNSEEEKQEILKMMPNDKEALEDI